MKNERFNESFNVTYSTNSNHRYINETTQDVKEVFGTFYNNPNLKVNWVDNERVEVFFDSNEKIDVLKIWTQQGIDLYFVPDHTVPVATNYSSGYISYMQTFTLSYKLTFLRAFIARYKNDNDIYMYKRSNVFAWDPRINKPCPKVKKLMEDKLLRTEYMELTFGSNSWQYYNIYSGAVTIPAVIYYVFADDGKFFIYPLLDGNDSLDGSTGGVVLRYRNYSLSGNNASQDWKNNIVNLNKYASQMKTSGFIGKFFGLNWGAVNNPGNLSWSQWFRCGPGGRFVEKNYGSNYFKGLMFTNDIWTHSDNPYNFNIDRNVNTGLLTSFDDNTYNFEHLRYLNVGIFKNTFDLPTLYWCIYGSRENSAYTSSSQISLKCIDTQLKGDGFYVTFKNISGSNNYLNFVDPEAAVFHLSDQLPVPVDTYAQWSNDNATQIRSNLAIKEVTAAVGVLTSAVIGAVGLLAAPVTGGASLGATLAAVGGIAGAIGGVTSMATAGAGANAAFEQSEKKYHGNIVSGGGVDFSYYNYYLKDLVNGTVSKNYRMLKYNRCVFDQPTFRAINEIVYYFGYPCERFTQFYLFGTSGSLDFIYNEFDIKQSPRLQRRIADFTSILPNWCNESKIAEYISKRLEEGVRFWLR